MNFVSLANGTVESGARFLDAGTRKRFDQSGFNTDTNGDGYSSALWKLTATLPFT